MNEPESLSDQIQPEVDLPSDQIQPTDQEPNPAIDAPLENKGADDGEAVDGLDPSIDPKKLVNQEGGQIEDVNLATWGATAEHSRRNGPQVSVFEKPNGTIEENADNSGTRAMISEVARRTEKLLPAEVEEELRSKVVAAAEQAFLNELERMKQKVVEDANAVAEDILRKLQGNNGGDASDVPQVKPEDSPTEEPANPYTS